MPHQERALRRMLRGTALSLSVFLAVSGCKSLNGGSGVKDQSEDAQANGVKMSKAWWEKTRLDAAAFVGQSIATTRNAQDLYAAANGAGLFATKNASIDANQKAQLIEKSAKLAEAVDRSSSEAITVLTRINKALKEYFASKSAVTEGANDSSGQRYVKPDLPHRLDNSVCPIGDFIADQTQNWGPGGPTAQQKKGVLELTDATLEFYVQLQSRYAKAKRAFATGTLDSGEATALLNDFSKAEICAQDIKRRIDSWWDYDKDDFDSCSPFASGINSGFKNLMCRWYPFAGYVVQLVDRDNDKTLCDNAQSGGDCVNQHQTIKQQMQVAFDELKIWGKYYDWKENGTIVGSGDDFINAGQQERQPPQNMRVDVTPPGGQIVCNIRKQVLTIPAHYWRVPLKSDLYVACGIFEKTRPQIPTCSIQVNPQRVGAGQTTNVTLVATGEVADAKWWDGQSASNGQTRQVPVSQNGQQFAATVTGSPWKDQPGQSSTCNAAVGTITAPVCAIQLSSNNIQQGQAITFVVVHVGGDAPTAVSGSYNTASHPTPTGLNVTLNQPVSFTPDANGTVFATCSNPGGSTPTTTTFGVNTPPPPPPPVANQQWCAGGPIIPTKSFGSDQAAAIACAKNILKFSIGGMGRVGPAQDPGCRFASVGRCTMNNWANNPPNNLTLPNGTRVDCNCIPDTPKDFQDGMRLRHRNLNGPEWIGSPSRQF